MRYAYYTYSELESIKLTISYTMILHDGGDIHFILDAAIELILYKGVNSSGIVVPKNRVYEEIYTQIKVKAGIYYGNRLRGLCIRMYRCGKKEKELPLSNEQIETKIFQLINTSGEGQEVQAMQMKAGGKDEDVKGRKRRYSNYITKLKGGSRERRAFIVADTTTLLIDLVHVPYAIGFLVVNPGEDVGAKGVS